MEAEFLKNSFTIAWQIKNYKFLSFDDRIYNDSPLITCDILDKTSFRLGLCLSLNGTGSIRISLEKNETITPPEEKILDYHFSLYTDQFPLQRFQKSFHDYSINYLFFDVPKAEIYEREAERFLLPDALTIECRICCKKELLSEDGECMLVTEPIFKIMSLVGVVKNFSDLKRGKEKAVTIRFALEENSVFSMNIGLTDKEEIFTKIKPLNYKKIRVCSCVLHMLDSSRNEVKCGQGEFISYNEEPKCGWVIPMQFPNRNPMELDKKYLPNDCLSLKCDLRIFTGEFEIKFSQTRYGRNLLKDNEHPVSGKQNDSEITQEGNQIMLTVQDDLMSLLSSGILSDTKLRTATETFPAHKSILSARSSVFKAMFTNNMKENIRDCVEIEDLDADTVRRLLLFLYSDNLQDLDSESAKKLYFAGDKYEVLTLKYKCSCFLIKNLSTSNCIDLLILADRHSDSDLKKAVQEYIAQHDKEILQSDHWKNLEKTNPYLSLETFGVMYKRNRRNS